MDGCPYLPNHSPAPHLSPYLDYRPLSYPSAFDNRFALDDHGVLQDHSFFVDRYAGFFGEAYDGFLADDAVRADCEGGVGVV